MTFPLIITFHTDDPHYTAEVQGLLESCKEHQLEVHCEVLPQTGSWTHSCALKGPYVLKCLERFQRPLLWLDADAVIVRRPVLFDTIGGDQYDFAAYYHQPKQEIISACLWFNYSPAALLLASEWADLCHKDPSTWDQKLLQQAHSRQLPSTLWLPFSYNKIFNRSCDDPTVIQQNQASRRLRRLVTVQ